LTPAESIIEQREQHTEARPCDIAIRDDYGWRRHRSGAVVVWLKGWMEGLDGDALARRLDKKDALSPEWFGDFLLQLNGHFALVAAGSGWAAAAVDCVRSIPLAAARVGDRWTVDDQPERLRRLAGLGPADIDQDAALSLGMAGYTIDSAALYRGLELLVPGELIWFANGKACRHRYYTYRPWHIRYSAGPKLEKELAETTLAVMERMLDQISFDAPDLSGQQIVIDAAYVQEKLADIVKDEDLSRYIL